MEADLDGQLAEINGMLKDLASSWSPDLSLSLKDTNRMRPLEVIILGASD